MAVAKMRRIFLVGPSDEKERTMKFLQEAGVVHIEPSVKLAGEMERQYSAIQQQARKIGQVCEGMSHFKEAKGEISVEIPDEELVSYCESRLAELEEIRNRKQTLHKLINELQVWGDFDPEKIKVLERDRVFIQRFRMEGKLKRALELPEDLYMEVVSEKPALNFFTVRIGEPVQIPQAIQLRNPEMGLTSALKELEDIKDREKSLILECSSLSKRIEVLKGLYRIVVNEASYAEYLGTIYAEKHLFGLQGWIPADNEEDLAKKITSSGLPLMTTTRDPLEDETPPTLFKNNWFIRQIEPLLKLYGLPDYRSIDPCYFFAPFMVLFFGICLGDAGYGLVFLLASYWIKKKWGNLSKELPLVMKLCQTFSISAIIIGILTGSVFGHDFKSRDWVLIDIDLDEGNPMILFYASLGLGVMHLSLSYIIGMLDARKRNDKLQKLGLMFVLWGGSFLISRNIWFSTPSSPMNMISNYAGWGFLALGVLLTFFSASDSKKWLIRIGLGFWSVYGLTGLIGDLLSYARLFGLGIATTAIAAVMNQLAGSIYDATGPVIGGILAVLLLIMGHAFNLVLSVLGSTVHSARLHFVEAFRSFFRGGGIQYKPFKIERG